MHALELEILGAGKSFGSFRALDEVSLKIRAGTIHALLGENGSGKSTLIKILSGFHRPDAGTVEIGGADPLLGDYSVVLKCPTKMETVGRMKSACGKCVACCSRPTSTSSLRASSSSGSRRRRSA